MLDKEKRACVELRISVNANLQDTPFNTLSAENFDTIFPVRELVIFQSINYQEL